jgi:hypothetical protein
MAIRRGYAQKHHVSWFSIAEIAYLDGRRPGRPVSANHFTPSASAQSPHSETTKCGVAAFQLFSKAPPAHWLK